jgi:predicted RNase H-like HicB family nuclease
MKAQRKFTVVIERDEEDYYVATVPALRGCHTQAKNLDTLMKRVRDVIQLCLEDGEAVPSLELEGIQEQKQTSALRGADRSKSVEYQKR